MTTQRNWGGIDDDKAKLLLLDHLSRKSNNSFKNSLKELDIIDRDHYDIFIYSLKTFVKIDREDEIYMDMNGNNLNPNIEFPQGCSPPNFQIKTCSDCDGRRFLSCGTCDRYKHQSCERCHNTYERECCSYTGYQPVENCKECKNAKMVICKTCNGNGQLKYYRGRTRVSHCIDDIVTNCKDNEIPLKVIQKSKGKLIVDESKLKLDPISHFPDERAYSISKELLIRHEIKLNNNPNWIQQNQSHKLYAIPVVAFKAQSKKKIINFWVLGENANIYVHVPNSLCSIC